MELLKTGQDWGSAMPQSGKCLGPAVIHELTARILKTRNPRFSPHSLHLQFFDGLLLIYSIHTLYPRKMATERLQGVLSHLKPTGIEAFTQKNPDDIVVTCALRTPFTKAGKGGLKDTPFENLLISLMKVASLPWPRDASG